ncbi:MAG: preprotein translocase subunit SecE [Cyanobacteriota bacterium]
MKGIARFFGEVRVELARVEWPSWAEFVGSTIVVLMLVAVFAIFLGVVDRLLEWGALKIFERGFGA